MDEVLKAVARLVNAGATALESYTKLQEKKAEYFANASSATPSDPDKPFEEFTPGYFERTHAGKIT
jgi:hypothetical protein